MGDLAILRSHRWGEDEAGLFARLQGWFGADRVLAVLDESRGVLATPPGLAKLSLTPASLAALGFAGLPPDWGWRCGDLCYYAAAAARPGRGRYWLFEPDLWWPDGAAGDAIFAALAARPEQALAAALGERPSHDGAAGDGAARDEGGPKYSRLMGPLCGTNRWGCLFPLTRVAGDLIAPMAALRRASLAQIAPRHRLFPNDEAILAAAVFQCGASHGDLYRLLARHFRPRFFATNPPHLREALARAKAPLVAHPAIGLQAILAEIDRHGPGAGRGYGPHRLRRVLKEALPPEAAAIHAALARKI